MPLWSAQPFGADSERFMDESLDVLQGSFKLVHSALYTRIKRRIYVYLSIDTLQTSLSLLKYKKRFIFIFIFIYSYIYWYTGWSVSSGTHLSIVQNNLCGCSHKTSAWEHF